ncbi:ABC transporter ATP-binding protein [Paenibacillus sp. CAA11]|uniref:ATP-binding cassette domain-containing protein n=1 Tax=Paenibacillus sp. CAA11 TaxID=1532905 RepID=UPI000D382B76|nr:ABC transporter ATP-binding protein [Paenibacillus sp. CAA11]AWB46007.1 ABC transporter ATP-binding protein [Paenibacillus sp. CAA11]
MIRINQLEQHLGDFSLCVPSAELLPGITLIVGANGAGKTTLLELLSTVRLPRKGQILYQQMSTADHLPLIRSQIGYVPSEIELYGEMSIYKLLSYLAELKGVIDPANVQRVIAEFQLAPLRRTKIKRLSQGQQRRVAVAQSMLAFPRFLFLDEPLNGLDTEERKRIIARLVSYAPGRVIAACVHELNEWEGVCDQVLWIEQGRIRFLGSGSSWRSNLPLSVWEGQAGRSQFESIPPSQLIHFRAEEDGFYVRIVADTPPVPGMLEASPTMEDAYFIRRVHGQMLAGN